jgi:hypothetical protein
MVLEFRSPDWTEPMVREWLLLLLRFAITRQPSDRSAACAVAEQLDSLGRPAPPSAFHFFRRSSEELCQAILSTENRHAELVLRRHIMRIEDARIRLAFQAAVGIAPSFRSPAKNKRNRWRKDPDFWKGLRSR